MEVNLPKMPQTNDLESLKGYINRLYNELTFLLSTLEDNYPNDGADCFSALTKLSFQLEELRETLDYSFQKTASSSGVMRIGDVVFSFGRALVGENKTVGVALAPLNIRSGPGTSYGILGSIPQYKEAEILSENGGWAKVKYGGVEGYSSLDYLNVKSGSGGSNVIPLGYSYLEPPAVIITPESSGSLSRVTNGTIELSGAGVINYLAIGR